MGGGGKSSSSNSTRNKNVSGSSAIDGDNLGVVLSGVSDSRITMTDYGAIQSAAGIAKNAIAGNNAAIKDATSLSRDALKENSNVSKSAMDNMRSNSKDSISAVSAIAAQSGANTRAALMMAEHTASRRQTGSSAEMSKVAIAVVAAVGIGLTAMAVSR